VSQGYDLSQRAYILDRANAGRPSAVSGELRSTEDSPVDNVALVIKNWGDRGAALTVDGKPVTHGRDFRFGHVRTLEGTDLVVWFKAKTVRPLTFVVKPQ
jgi:hypothetical protein